jgi:hypothetical protein
MTTKNRNVFAKIVLQGAFGSPYSNAYRDASEARELNRLLDQWEIQTASFLKSRIADWAELEVLMAFVWPCGESFTGIRRRYLKSEHLLEVSICIAPEEFRARSADEKAESLLKVALSEFITAFHENGKNPGVLEALLDSCCRKGGPDAASSTTRNNS